MRNCVGKGEIIILVKDTKGNIFGGCFSQPLEVKDDFYGTGESFLFKLDTKNKDLAIYTSTMQNCFFCYCDHEGIGMGSDEHYGLFIDSSLNKGSSHCCKTYANAVLTEGNHFAIYDVEVRCCFLF